MRPRRLAEVVGQEHILRPGSLLPRLVAQNRFGSLLFYGPPGSGKTSIAEAIARETRSRFVRVNAVMSNVAELRDILAAARRRPERGHDPLHRRTAPLQQIPAGPAAARCRGGQRPPDRRHDPQSGLLRQSAAAFAAATCSGSSRSRRTRSWASSARPGRRGAGPRRRRVHGGRPGPRGPGALCDGDLRRALNALEVMVLEPAGAARRSLRRSWRSSPASGASVTMPTRTSTTTPSPRSSRAAAAAIPMRRCTGWPRCWREARTRGSSPAAWSSWRARTSGSPTRRRCRWPWRRTRRCDFVGLPEAELTLAHATLYIATAPKSNSATVALGGRARAVLADQPVQSVPIHLRDKGGQASKTDGPRQGLRLFPRFPGGGLRPGIPGETARASTRQGPSAPKPRSPSVSPAGAGLKASAVRPGSKQTC